ncbi:MAG: restriction endonuclease subunit S [Myxococcus sp.]|nr:restriction endonuclease subunit S [Myxococcus sp.]
MELKAGFKDSDVGPIPADWVTNPFLGVLQKIEAKRHQILASEYLAAGSIPVVDQGQSAIAGYSDRLDKRLVRPDGGVIIFGDHTRTVKYADFDFVVGADGTQLLIGKNGNDTQFLFYQLQAKSIPSTGYARHFKFVKEMVFRVPPVPVQRAIAAALGDVDALLAGLDKLIAKKRDLKQAAMQQLLTGETRLPGFRKAWELTTLGHLFEFRNGVNADKRAYGRGVPFINVLEVITKPHLHAGDVPGRVSLSQSLIEAYAVRRGDVVFNRTSETQEEVALASVYMDTTTVVFGGFVIRGRPSGDRLDATYSGYALRAPEVRQQLVAKGQGAIRANVGQSEMRTVRIRLPEVDEQKAIAAALWDMDAEVAALEARRDKTRAVKQGMMQELLSGRTRLV